MRVLFLLPAFGKSVSTHLGLAQVSAALRVAGCETALLKVNRELSANNIVKQALTWKPDMVAVSCVTHHWRIVMEWAACFKRVCPDVPFTVGGAHATVDSDSVMACKDIDAVMVGEGEHGIVSLVEAYHKGKKPQGIAGVASRVDGEWWMTPPDNFCQDLDSLPFADRTIFGSELGGDFPVMVGRGCPFDCTYCCNHILKKAQDGRYVRVRSPEHVIAEIKKGMEWTDIRRIVFEDDTFTLMKPWLKDFLPLYKKEVSLPFVANARVGSFDRETAEMLKEAGCDYVLIGVETGCEKLRREILNRQMSNDSIIETFDMTKEVGLHTYAFYMIGFPTETIAMARETLDMHLRIQPEAGFQISVFYPYPNTRLWEIARERGMVAGHAEKSTFEGGDSTLVLKDMTREELSSLYGEFERMRLESSFGDRYIASNYPWAKWPVRIASALFGKAKILRWAKSMRDRLSPATDFRVSKYKC